MSYKWLLITEGQSPGATFPEAKAQEGFYVIKGRFDNLRQFLHTLRESGVEKALMKCGWMVTCHFVNIYEPIKADVILFRKPLATAVSAKFVRALLRSTLVCIGMPRPVKADDRSVLTKIKLWGTIIFHGHLDRNMQMQDLLDVWEQASTIVCDMVPVRLVGTSGFINPDYPLRYYTRCDENNQTVATVNFMIGLHGGGYTDKQPGNPQEYLVQQRNALATFLISQGADIQGCLKFIENVVHGAGPGAIASILGQKQPAKRWDGLIQLASALHIQTPDIVSRMSKARDKVQNRLSQQSRQPPKDLPVESLLLQTGFIRNADGTACNQIQKLVPNSTGVVLMTEEQALPWLQEQAVISQDELAIAVIGSQRLCENFDGTRIRIPVSHNGEPLILQATLYNLGAKEATMSQQEVDMIPVSDSQVIAITAFQDEIDSDSWAAILQSPVKNIMKILLPDHGDYSFLSSPWGRSFQKAGKKVEPKIATSIQFHARVLKADLRMFLKASGTSGIYTVPKSEDRQILTDFQVVWLQQSTVELAVSLSRCDNHCGIVRGLKSDGKGRGIRFARQDFAAAHALLKPDAPSPSHVVSNFLFKVAPTPLGTTLEQIQAWLAAQSFEAKPIRALSSTVWLCGTESKFDSVFLQWNDTPVLIRWVNQKKGKDPIILAGNFKQEIKTRSVTQQDADPGTNLSEDPWKIWIENKGGTGLTSMPGPSKTIATPVLTQPPRKLEAPIEDRFNAHQSALQELRDKGEKDIEAIRGDIAKLEKTMQAQQQQVQYNMEMTNAEFKAIRSEASTQFQSITTTFQESLQKALQQHDHQMYNQFSELKQLMLNKGSKMSPPQKKPRSGNVDDLSDSDAKL